MADMEKGCTRPLLSKEHLHISLFSGSISTASWEASLRCGPIRIIQIHREQGDSSLLIGVQNCMDH